MKYTDNYKLKKPEATDAYNIDDFNENIDVVDAELKAHSNEISQLKAPAYEVAKNLAELESGESYTTFFGKVKKAITDLISHLANKSNPHSVTAKQVGLDKVPNVATNDQTPTYTESSSLTNLVSGEKLSVAFGKIKKAITDLITHLSNKSNPHKVTASQVGAASSVHTHGELIPKLAVYYSGTTGEPPDIDTITDGLVLIPTQFSKDCPVGGSFVYIRQLFYGGEGETNLRTQVAFPYGTKSGAIGSGVATRTHLGEGVWTDWEKVGEIITEDISDNFIKNSPSTLIIEAISVFKAGNVISGYVKMGGELYNLTGTSILFTIDDKYKPKCGTIVPQFFGIDFAGENYISNAPTKNAGSSLAICLINKNMVMDVMYPGDIPICDLSELTLSFNYICE